MGPWEAAAQTMRSTEYGGRVKKRGLMEQGKSLRFLSITFPTILIQMDGGFHMSELMV